jgi:hypothetical protein
LIRSIFKLDLKSLLAKAYYDTSSGESLCFSPVPFIRRNSRDESAEPKKSKLAHNLNRHGEEL